MGRFEERICCQKLRVTKDETIHLRKYLEASGAPVEVIVFSDIIVDVSDIVDGFSDVIVEVSDIVVVLCGWWRNEEVLLMSSLSLCHGRAQGRDCFKEKGCGRKFSFSSH
jgi:hypothetical protein